LYQETQFFYSDRCEHYIMVIQGRSTNPGNMKWLKKKT